MSKNHHGGPGPVPPGNRSHAGPQFRTEPDEGRPAEEAPDTGAGFEPQDPQRRLGDFEGTGEHSRQQPGAANDGDRHSK
jgi:hypothetical protein